MAKFFKFKGRLNRKPFWIMNLVLWVVGLISTSIAIAFTGVDPYMVLWLLVNHVGFEYQNLGTGPIVMLVIYPVMSIALAVSGISISVRRLHDRDRSGWWVLGIPAFSIALFVLMALSNSLLLLSIAIVFIMIIGIWYFIELAILKGTTGPNSYGSDPLDGPENSEIFGR